MVVDPGIIQGQGIIYLDSPKDQENDQDKEILTAEEILEETR